MKKAYNKKYREICITRSNCKDRCWKGLYGQPDETCMRKLCTVRTTTKAETPSCDRDFYSCFCTPACDDCLKGCTKRFKEAQMDIYNTYNRLGLNEKALGSKPNATYNIYDTFNCVNCCVLRNNSNTAATTKMRGPENEKQQKDLKDAYNQNYRKMCNTYSACKKNCNGANVGESLRKCSKQCTRNFKETQMSLYTIYDSFGLNEKHLGKKPQPNFNFQDGANCSRCCI